MSETTGSPTAATATRAEICCVAVSDCFQEDHNRLVNPIGTIPMIGGRLARETHTPSAVMTDGYAMFAANTLPPGADPELAVVESWNPYPQMFSVLWGGRRHVMMGASQIDRFGNQNLACIGDWNRPKSQLLGFRGAPGNTINHTTSYWVPRHTTTVFVANVDVVCGVGTNRARALGPAGRFHHLHRVVSNLGVFDFEPVSGEMRVLSVHPGVDVSEVVEATGFELHIAADLHETRLPTHEELHLIRHVIDPHSLRTSEVRN